MALPILPTNLSIPPITLPVLPSTQTAPVSKVEGFQQNAQTSLNNFLAGEGEELHHVAIATQQAELSFQLFMQVRNKIVAAYQQVMQMQV
jgi:flagellar hook-basal body complex protein FliE